MFKKASWFLALLLGGVLLYAAVLLPAPGDPGSPAWRHVSPRFIHRSLEETGLASPVLAVLSDYRSFDLLLLNFIFFTAGLYCLILFSNVKPFRFYFPLLGLLVGLGLGFFCLWEGSNFLDYEPLAHYIKASQARIFGERVLGAGLLISVLGTGAVFYGAFRLFREGPLERS